jgi:hypothetical protein
MYFPLPPEKCYLCDDKNFKNMVRNTENRCAGNVPATDHTEISRMAKKVLITDANKGIGK